MAIKEGRCPNCGSILHLDSNAEKGHCLFCDAVFQNKTAIEIASDPQSYDFPNLPQPKYEGPSLEPNYMAETTPGKHHKKSQQAVKKTPKPIPPVYIPKEPEKLPEIKMSREAKLKSLIISVIVIALIAGISIPLIMMRNNNRAAILARMDLVAPFTVEAENDVSIRRINNSYMLITADSDISQEDMVSLFKNYCEQRAVVMNLDMADFNRVYKPVTVKLVMPGGGYLISGPESLSELESGEIITELK